MATGVALNPGERLKSEEGMNPAKCATLPNSKGCGCGLEQAGERLSSEPVCRNLISGIYRSHFWAEVLLFSKPRAAFIFKTCLPN